MPNAAKNTQYVKTFCEFYIRVYILSNSTHHPKCDVAFFTSWLDKYRRVWQLT